jgi:hypothetical protein
MFCQPEKKQSKPIMQWLEQRLHAIKQCCAPSMNGKTITPITSPEELIHTEFKDDKQDTPAIDKTFTPLVTELEANEDALRSTNYSTDSATKISSILRTKGR